MTENKKVSENSTDLDLIFSDLGDDKEKYIVCKLPSRGLCYQDSKDEVAVRPLTFEDEKVLATTKAKNPLNVVLSRCCTDLDIDNLLLMDRTAIFLKLREVSFGNDYNARINCPECGTISEVKLSISDFPVDELPEDFKEPREVYLEEIQRKVYVRSPRVKDESYFENINSIHTNLWRFIDKIQVKKDKYTEDKTFVAKVIEKLPRKDIHNLIAKISLAGFGYETKFMFNCGHCSTENLMEAPFGPDFFSENLD
tara:strand:- start:416 stop:1177 length:762 start_codon:yes stop_codon:yes gene_type:complete